ncbi:MAG: cobalamin-binding protein [Blastocatellia bacterium]|nr:cobalamin-binding protein [Blastocatellia bacterium]
MRHAVNGPSGVDDVLRRGKRAERIVCLTEETTETLYLLGEGDRVVGISGYTVRPPEARRKPKVSAYITAKFDKIEALEPDLVLAFSDLQADICAELIRRGLTVVCFNQRSVADILEMIEMVGALAGVPERGQDLASSLRESLVEMREESRRVGARPRVFFEEWYDPLISGIRWVSELIEIAWGEDIFSENRAFHDGKRRIVDPDEVIRRDPEVIIASWCGRKFQPDVVRARPGWDRVSAVRDNRLCEVKSAVILQPGPASLTEGVRALRKAIVGE